MRTSFRAIQVFRSFSGVAGGGVALPLSPAVWHLIENNHIDPSSIRGTGKGGRLLKGDVLKAIENKSARKLPQKPPSPPQASLSPSSHIIPLRRSRAHQDLQLTEVRREAAHRFGESKASVPHSYARISCSLHGVFEALKALQGKAKVELSVGDFVIAAAARALRKVPEVNAICTQGEPRQLDTVNINLALETVAGLVTPLIADADKMGLAQIAQAVAALRSNPVSDQGGSFTIYDLQASGLTSFTAVINPPQAAILAVASGPGPVLNATLSLDVRVGDDLLAAKWLSAFQLALDNLGL